MPNKNGVFFFILNRATRLTGGEPCSNSALCRKSLPIPGLDVNLGLLVTSCDSPTDPQTKQ